MRKLIIPTIILAILAAGATLPAAAQAAKSCSVSSRGGLKAADVEGDGSVNEGGPQGYKCTVAWDSDVQPQYESGGTWHYCTECSPAFHPNTPDRFWPANTAFNWTGLVAWFPSASADTPVCSVNWRLQINFFDSTHFVFASDVSPQTNKTC